MRDQIKTLLDSELVLLLMIASQLHVGDKPAWLPSNLAQRVPKDCYKR